MKFGKMGKADKVKKAKGDVVAKSGPLESQMFRNDFAQPSSRQKQRRKEDSNSQVNSKIIQPGHKFYRCHVRFSLLEKTSQLRF